MMDEKSRSEQDLCEIFNSIGKHQECHRFTEKQYSELDKLRQETVARLFQKNGENVGAVQFGHLGKIVFPFHSMGAITSLDLFGLDELILFEFYRINKGRYQNVVDIGANIGLHSIVMGMCGMQVASYEPDPGHFKILELNVAKNGINDRVQLNQAAVSSRSGRATFVRVLGNTTGSHLKEAKTGAYGELEEFKVDVIGIHDVIAKADLLKIDAEGEEANILLETNNKDWDFLDAVVEVGNSKNAAQIFNHFSSTSVNLMAQKSGWMKVNSPEEMPQSYREGSLFITKQSSMPWESNEVI